MEATAAGGAQGAPNKPWALVTGGSRGIGAAMRGQRKDYEHTGNPDDELTDEQFRRIEFGDDEL